MTSSKKIIIKKEDLPKPRIPTAPPQKAFKDKSKYNRKKKHKDKSE
jgi:hypothetical protein